MKSIRAILIIGLLIAVNSAYCQKKNIVKKDTIEPLFESEILPQFPGGIDSLLKFISKTVVYPKMARETGISGTVKIYFVVNKNGDVTNIKIIKGIGGGCDEEAIRVVKLLPKWKPGLQNGKKVSVYFTLPIVFSFSK